MEIIVEDRKVNFSNVTIRIMGFGQEFYGYVKLPYRFTLSKYEFFEKFETIFNNFVTEIKVDDEKYGDEDVIGLYEQGYPNLEEAMSNKKKFLSLLIQETLATTFLDQFFTSTNRSEWQYIINSIDDLVITDDFVTVTGGAYKNQAK